MYPILAYKEKEIICKSNRKSQNKQNYQLSDNLRYYKNSTLCINIYIYIYIPESFVRRTGFCTAGWAQTWFIHYRSEMRTTVTHIQNAGSSRVGDYWPPSGPSPPGISIVMLLPFSRIWSSRVTRLPCTKNTAILIHKVHIRRQYL